MLKQKGMFNKFLLTTSIALLLAFNMQAQDTNNDAEKNQRVVSASGKWLGGGTNTSFISVGQMGTSTLLTVTDGQTKYGASFGFLRPLIAEKEPNRPPVAIAPSTSVSINTNVPSVLKPIELNGNDPDNDPIDFVITEQPKNGTIEVFGTTGRKFSYSPNASLTTGIVFKDTIRFKVVESQGELESEVAIYPFTFSVEDKPHTIKSFSKLDLTESKKAFEIRFEDNVFNPFYEITLSYIIPGSPLVDMVKQNIVLSDFEVNGNVLSKSFDINAENYPDIFTTDQVTAVLDIKGGNYSEADVLVYSNSASNSGGNATFTDFNIGDLVTSNVTKGDNKDGSVSPDGKFFTFASKKFIPENSTVKLSLFAVELGDYDLSKSSISITEGPLVGIVSNPINPILTKSNRKISQWVVRYETRGEKGYLDSLQFSVNNTERKFVSSKYAVVDVADVNDAPSLGNIADQEMNEDGSLKIEPTFEDVDSELKLIAISSNGDNVPVTVNGKVLSINPKANYNGRTTISVILEESDEDVPYTILETFDVKVNPVNDRPVLSAINNQSIDEDATFTYTLETTDIDAAVPLFSYNVNPSIQGVSTISMQGNTLTVTPNKNYNGQISFSITADDGLGTNTSLSDAQTFNLAINAVNDAPVVTSTIPTQNIIQGFPKYLIDLGEYFEDVETADDDLTYSIGAQSTLFTMSISGDVLSISPIVGKSGSEDITITASDGILSANQTVKFNLASLGANITTTAVQNVTLNEDFGSSQIDLSGAFVDQNDANAVFSYTVIGLNNLGSSIDGNILKITPSQDFNGTENVFVIGSANGAPAFLNFDVNVNPVHDGPTLDKVENKSIQEDFSLNDLFIGFKDIDTKSDNLAFTVSSSDESIVKSANITVKKGSSGITIDATPESNANGEVKITVVITDDGQLSDKVTFDLTVSSINDAPVANTTGLLDATEDSEYKFDLTKLFSDVDDNALKYSLEDAPSWVKVSENSLTGTPKNNDVGRVEFTIISEDRSGATARKQYTLNVINTNDAPILSSAAEDITTNEDELLLALIPSSVFEDIDGDKLTLSASFSNVDWLTFNSATNRFVGTPDNDDVGTVNITITATDPGGKTVSDEIILTVVNTNDTPTDIGLSSLTVLENQSIGAIIGALTSTDVDKGDPFSYYISESEISDAFSINGKNLVSNAKLDFETNPTVSVTIVTRDAAEAEYKETFTIAVQNVNETPTDLRIDNTTIVENLSSGTSIGTLSSTDEDANDTFTYELVSGDGDTDNSSFSIESGALVSAASFDFETKSSYSIRVKTSDAGGLSYEEVVTISVSDINEAPSDLALDATTIVENAATGTTIGSISSTDEDANDTFTYELVSGEGDTDNSSFSIESGALVSAASFNFESKASYSIRLKTSDAGGLSYEEAVSISVSDANDSPTDLALDATTIVENAATGTTVGSISSTDEDANDTFTYELVSGEGDTDNISFSIESGALVSAASFNFESKASYSIRLKTSDADGLTYEEVVTISVSDANDSPTDLSIDTNVVDENADVGTVVGTVSGTDEDNGETFTFSLVSGTGDSDNASFEISDDKLTTKESFDFETKSEYSVRVSVTDAGGASYEEAISINIQNVAEPAIADIDDISFDPTPKGETAQVSFTIENTGDTPVEVTEITLPAAYSVASGAFTVAVGASTQVEVTFAPTEAQTYSGQIVIQSTVGETVINVAGEGVQVTAIDDEYLDSEEASIYPNPSSDYVTIDLSKAPSIQPTIVIVDLKGQQMWMKKDVKEEKVTVDVRTYPVGTYLVRINSDKGTIVKKFMFIK